MGEDELLVNLLLDCRFIREECSLSLCTGILTHVTIGQKQLVLLSVQRFELHQSQSSSYQLVHACGLLSVVS